MTNIHDNLLKIAKYSILEKFWDKTLWSLSIKDNELNEIKSCFVTLKKNGELRWCIWSIIPRQTLYKDIIENAKNSAFKDPRFPSLKKEELDDLEIEITVLSPMQEKTFDSYEQLIEFLDKEKCWLVIRLWYRSATFLPSVWEQLPDVEDFIIHLLYKAWISPNEFRNNFQFVEIMIYYWKEIHKRFTDI